MQGQIARRAQELGGFPPRPSDPRFPKGERVHSCRENGEKPRHISETHLIAALRKIDLDLAHMIESLAPVYLVKG